jgi:hypothetical protein
VSIRQSVNEDLPEPRGPAGVVVGPTIGPIAVRFEKCLLNDIGRVAGPRVAELEPGKKVQIWAEPVEIEVGGHTRAPRSA